MMLDSLETISDNEQTQIKKLINDILIGVSDEPVCVEYSTYDG